MVRLGRGSLVVALLAFVNAQNLILVPRSDNLTQSADANAPQKFTHGTAAALRGAGGTKSGSCVRKGNQRA